MVTKYIKSVTGAEWYKDTGGQDNQGNSYVLVYGNLDYDDAQKIYEVSEPRTILVRLQDNGKLTGFVRNQQGYYVRSGPLKGFYIDAQFAKEVGPPTNLGATWGAEFGSKTLTFGTKMTRWLTASSLNVRADTSTDSKVVKKISKGQKVTDLQSVDGHDPWCYSKELGGYVVYGDNKTVYWDDKAPAKKPSTTVTPKEPTGPEEPTVKEFATDLGKELLVALALAGVFLFAVYSREGK